MKKVRFSRVLLAAMFTAGSFLPLVPVDTAEAVSGACYFNTTVGPVGGTSGCSETGLGEYGVNDVLTGRSKSGNGSAIPNSVNTKSEFVKFVLNRFNNGGTQNRIGAAFIMQEMRGSRAWPGTAQRDDWVARMNQSNVSVSSQWDSKVGRTSWYDNDKKNTFYGDHPNVGRQVINVRQNGKVIAQIEHLCGNMVAGAAAITPSKKWDVDPTTAISAPKIMVGEKVTWTHKITNKGPDTMTRGGTYKINGATATSTTGSYAAHTKGWVGTLTRSYVAQADDVGKKYCQSLTITPNSSTASGAETSPNQCVDIIGSYELTPEASVNSTPIVEAGAEVDVKGTVTNESTTAGTAEWQFTNTVVAPDGSITSVTKDNGSDPCVWFGNDCSVKESGTKKFNGTTNTFDGTVTVADLPAASIPDLPVGTKVCWAVSVKPPTSTSTDWRHSKPVCVTIGKKPKLQVLGGDTRVRGEIKTSTSTVNVADFGGNRLFGSWTEFGVMSTEDNIAMASGAALRKGNASQDQSGWSDLTFANVVPFVPSEDTYVYGNYDSLPEPAAVSQYFSELKGTAISGSFSVSGKASGVYKANGNITLSGSTDKSIIIVANGTVTINGSGVSYSQNTFSSLKDIPQVVIIAEDININDGVSTVDAWLIANESINTCANKVTNVANPALTAKICDEPLTINGPVSTKALYLFRTAGSGTNTAIRDPAEQFNLRPETYLWAYNYGLERSRPTTASVVELPPRY